MKFFIVFAVLFAIALAKPQHHLDHQPHVEHHGEHHQILKLESEIDPKGFKYAFETSNGIQKDEEGQLKDVGHGHGDEHDHDGNHEAIVVHGSYAWIDEKTGAKFDIKYVADEYGYQPAPIKLGPH